MIPSRGIIAVMYVTKKNCLILHDALLKSFNAQSFIVINSWCEIGVKYANSYIGMLFTSGKYINAFSSCNLKRICFKTLDNQASEHPMKHQYPYNTLEDFSVMCNAKLADIKKILVKDIIRQMKYGEIYISRKEPNGWEIAKALSFEEFVVSFDMAFHADA